MRPIKIVGGGLAGLSLGIALRREGIDVTVHEALSYPRHRVCGEFISGVSEETLQQLGIHDLLAGVARPQEVQWWSGSQHLGSFQLPSAAYAVSRHRLDAQLCERLRELGGIVREQQRMLVAPEPGTVWAAGRRAEKGRWIGLKMHVRELELAAGLEMHLGTHGYVGLSAIEDGWINVCGLFRINSNIRAKPSELLLSYVRENQLTSLAERLAAATWRENSTSAVAGFRLGKQTPLDGIVTIGDAHSIIPPFTGNGMSMALEAAAMAIHPLCRYARHEQEWSETISAIQRHSHTAFHRRLKMANAFQHLLLARWSRRPMVMLASKRCLPFRALFSLTRS